MARRRTMTADKTILACTDPRRPCMPPLRHPIFPARIENPRHSTIARLVLNRRGGVSIIGVFALISIIGIAAFSIELGQGHQAKIEYQGAADAAALAAANAYVGNPDDAALIATAQDVARANGIAPANVTVSHLTNYSSAVSDAVQVTIIKRIPLYFARIFTSSASYNVSITAIASLSTATAIPCILALSSGGISLSGGTRINAPNCAIISNAALNVTGGSAISAKATQSSGGTGVAGGSTIAATSSVTYGTSATAEAGSSIQGSQIKRSNSTADPLVSNSRLAAAFAQIGSYTAPATPRVPPGKDLNLGYYPTTMTFDGYTGTLSGNTWTFPAGTYSFRNVNTSSLILKILGPSTITVSSSLAVGGGGGLILPDGPITIVAPISLSGGTSMTVGSGRHYFGQISVGGGSTASIGAGDMDVSGAILVDGGGSKVSIGGGNYTIGNNGSGTAINLSGGSSLSFGDGTFSANGAITTSGGSTLAFGTTANHTINGALNLNGSSTFGAGTYTINGGLTNNTGGTMTGSGVSFILAGTLNASGGTSIDLAAPSSGAIIGVPDVLFATRASSATILGGGTQDSYSGVIYVPNSDFQMSGGASATGSCFSIVASTVTLSSGPSAATACPSMGSSSGSGNVSLVR